MVDEGVIVRVETNILFLKMVVVKEKNRIRELKDLLHFAENVPHIDLSDVGDDHFHVESIAYLLLLVLDFNDQFMQLRSTLLKHRLLINLLSYSDTLPVL